MEQFDPIEVITRVLKPEGFVRHENCWFREKPTHYYWLILSTVNGDQFLDVRYTSDRTIPVGATFKDKWQASEHIEELLDLHGALTYSFEFKCLTTEERTERLENCLKDRIIPLLKQFSTPEGVKEFDPPKIITRVLKPEGFVRAGNYWFRETADHFYFLHLYAAGGAKYIDVNFSLKQCLSMGATFKDEWHGGMRVHERKDLYGAMIYCHEFRTLSQRERVTLLEQALLDRALPLLRRMSTRDGIRELFLSGAESGFHVTERCWPALGLPEKAQNG